VKTCDQTTRRMLELVHTNSFLRLWFAAAGLAPCGDRIDDDMTWGQAGDKVCRAAHELRRLAKREHGDIARAFSAVGSFDRVDWITVAWHAMCSINPNLDPDYGARLAAAQRN
jgi:hypothetical protein